MTVGINIEIKESENKGLLGISLGDLNGKPIVMKKKRKKKKKSELRKTLDSVMEGKPKYKTEVI